MEKLRIGIIGTGIGLRQIAPGFLKTGQVEITAVSGSSIDRTLLHVQESAIAGNNGVESNDLLVTDDFKKVCDSNDVDLICVTTPNEFHIEQMAYALNTDKHILLEKPVGMTKRETEDLVKLQGSKNRLVVVDHQLRFNPYFVKIKKLIEHGNIGKPYYISINHASPWIMDNKHDYLWSLDKELGGGVRLALGIHLIDLVRFFLGCEPYAVSATMNNIFYTYNPIGSKEFNSQVSLYFSANLNFPECDVVLSNSAVSHSGYQFDMMIRGDQGEIGFNLKDNAIFYKNNKDGEKIISDDATKEYDLLGGNTIFWNSFTYYAQIIVDAIQNGDNKIVNASGLDDAIKNMTVLDAMMTSSQNGTRELLGEWPKNQYS